MLYLRFYSWVLQLLISPLNFSPITLQASFLSEKQPKPLLSSPFCPGTVYLTQVQFLSLVCFPSTVYMLTINMNYTSSYSILLHWQPSSSGCDIAFITTIHCSSHCPLIGDDEGWQLYVHVRLHMRLRHTFVYGHTSRFHPIREPTDKAFVIPIV